MSLVLGTVREMSSYANRCRSLLSWSRHTIPVISPRARTIGKLQLLKHDTSSISSIILPTIMDGTTYALDPDIDELGAIDYWMGNDRQAFVAEEAGEILGTYYIKPNQAGGGSHVCNCGYMTSAAASGRGVATAMCQHSMSQAREAGFRAMQFNFVVATNEHAIRLWKRLGFEEVGRLPNAFLHQSEGYVDALVLYQTL